jgi:hypothetical protein
MSDCVIALIAEDDTDCDTIRKIVHRVLGKQTKTKKWSSGGCSKLRRKLAANLSTLTKAGTVLLRSERLKAPGNKDF